MTRAIGRYIVADTEICHGKPTFVGTRILVADVLEQVAKGMAWEVILDDWRGDVSKEAIPEAVRLARDACRTTFWRWCLWCPGPRCPGMCHPIATGTAQAVPLPNWVACQCRTCAVTHCASSSGKPGAGSGPR